MTRALIIALAVNELAGLVIAGPAAVGAFIAMGHEFGAAFHVWATIPHAFGGLFHAWGWLR